MRRCAPAALWQATYERQESLQNIADLYVNVEWLVSQNEQETTQENKNTSTEKEENAIMLYLLFFRSLPAALARRAELEEMFITISSSSSSRSRISSSGINISIISSSIIIILYIYICLQW